MRFSLWPHASQSWGTVLELARHAEARGWHGVWLADHFMPSTPDADGPYLECWSTLAGLAAAVPRVRIGALVSGNTYRHPAVLAKMAATVDHVSGGRVVLGLGAGWQENEHRAYGIPFYDRGERLARLAEACQVVRGLFAEKRVTFEGRYYELRDAPLEPKPVQDPLPVLVGGGGERVTLGIVARHADEWNVWGLPETVRHKAEVLQAHCAAVGRDPAEIRRSAQALVVLDDDRERLAAEREVARPFPALVGTPEEVRAAVADYQAAGVDELVVPDWNLGSGKETEEWIDRFTAEVVSQFPEG